MKICKKCGSSDFGTWTSASTGKFSMSKRLPIKTEFEKEENEKGEVN